MSPRHCTRRNEMVRENPEQARRVFWQSVGWCVSYTVATSHPSSRRADAPWRAPTIAQAQPI